jgi:hypothetical protein
VFLVLQEAIDISHQWNPIKSVNFVVLEKCAEQRLDLSDFFDRVVKVRLVVFAREHTYTLNSAEVGFSYSSHGSVPVHLCFFQVTLVVVANAYLIVSVCLCNQVADQPGKLQLLF